MAAIEAAAAVAIGAGLCSVFTCLASFLEPGSEAAELGRVAPGTSAEEFALVGIPRLGRARNRGFLGRERLTISDLRFRSRGDPVVE